MASVLRAAGQLGSWSPSPWPRGPAVQLEPLGEGGREARACVICLHCGTPSCKLILFFDTYRNLKAIMSPLSPRLWILTEGLGQFFAKLSSTAMVWKLHSRWVPEKRRGDLLKTHLDERIDLFLSDSGNCSLVGLFMFGPLNYTL